MLKQNLALIVPSRGRPQNIVRLRNAILNLSPGVHLYVGVDADDEKLEEYKAIDGIRLIVSEKRKRFGATLNSIAIPLAREYQFLAWMGDDHEPKTKNWDLKYIHMLQEMHVGVVYGNDLVMGQAIATQLAWTSNMVKALGYAVPEGFIHLYIDNYFMEIAKSIDKLAYLPDVIVQHHHRIAGAPDDKTYQEANSPENWSNDERRFREYVANELPEDKRKLEELL